MNTGASWLDLDEVDTEELNRRRRKTLDWQTPERLFATLRDKHV